MVRVIAGNWWAPATSGVLAILTGVVAMLWPEKTFAGLVLLFGVYAFVRGSIWLAFGLLAATARERWWPFVVNGVFGISIGVLTFAEPHMMTVALVSVLGAWTFLTGVLEVVAAIRFRRVLPNEFLLALGGVLSMVFGVAVIAQPTIGAATFAILFGAFAIVVGAAQLWLGVRLRTLLVGVPVVDELLGTVAP